MFYVNEKFPLGKSQVWYKKVGIINTTLLFNYLQTLNYEGGDYIGREIRREQRWHHRDATYFNPKWKFFKRWQSYSYETPLDFIEQKINNLVNGVLNFDDYIKRKHMWNSNSILINKYTNGKNVIPKHRDSEHIFGDNPVIAVYSVGSSRVIRFTRVHQNNNKKIKNEVPIDIKLEEGSLLIMSGTVQKYYVHEILKDDEITDTRYSLTFRNHKL